MGYAFFMGSDLVLSQTIFYVSNVPASVAFYRDRLGLTVTYPFGDEPLNEHWATLGAEGASLALHGGGPGLTGNLAPEIVFTTSDIEASRAHVMSKGVEMSEITEPHPDTTLCHGKDIDGNTFFLKQASH